MKHALQNLDAVEARVAEPLAERLRASVELCVAPWPGLSLEIVGNPGLKGDRDRRHRFTALQGEVAVADQMAHLAVPDPNRQAPQPHAHPWAVRLHPLSGRLSPCYASCKFRGAYKTGVTRVNLVWQSADRGFQQQKVTRPQAHITCAGAFHFAGSRLLADVV
jgi:hypothetical protein